MTRLLTLAIIFLLIVFYTYEVELPREEVKAKQEALLGGKTRKDIQSIEITNTKGSLALRHTGAVGSEEETAAQWEVAAVPGSIVDAGAMNALLSAVSELKFDQAIPAAEREADLGVYGLKEPEASLKIVLADGTTELRLGKINRYVSKRYVQTGVEGGLFLVPDTLFEAVNKTAEEFRSHTPIVFSDGDIAAVRLVRGAEEIVLRSKDHEWWLEKPLTAQASGNAFPDLARELRNLRAEEFVNDAAAKLKDYGLDPAELQVELTFFKQDRAPLRVRVGKRVTITKEASAPKSKAAPQEKKTEQFAFFVDGQPSVYTLKNDPLPQLFKKVNELREKRLFTFAGDRVRSVRFEEGSASWEMIKQDGNWKVGEKEGDATFISSYLFDLAQIEASSFSVPATGSGLDAPSLKITVTLLGSDGKDLVRTLLVGNSGKEDGKDVVYVAVNEVSHAFAITSDTHRRILPKRESFEKLVETPVETPVATPAGATSEGVKSDLPKADR